RCRIYNCRASGECSGRRLIFTTPSVDFDPRSLAHTWMKRTCKGLLACLAFVAFFIASCSKDSPAPDNGQPDPGDEDEEITLILPQKEVRGAWITTAYALDWPRTPDYVSTEYGAAAQQANYKTMLDMLKSKG